MSQQTFNNGETLSSVRTKLNSNANDSESRLSELEVGAIDSGTTAERPVSPTNFVPYFDTDLGYAVVYNGSEWVPFSNGGGSGSGATTYAWTPRANPTATGTNGSYLNLSAAPTGFLTNGADWSFAVRMGAVPNLNSALVLFASDVESGGVGIYGSPQQVTIENTDILISGATNSQYDGVFTQSTSNGRWANFDSQYSLGLYRIYKKDAGGGNWHVLVNDSNTAYWTLGTTTVDPDTWVNGTSYPLTTTEQTTNFASSEGGFSIPWETGVVSYTGGTEVPVLYWYRMATSNPWIDQDNDKLQDPNSWLVFSFDSAAGTVSAWVSGTKTNNGTAVTFALSQPTTVVFGQEAAGYTSAQLFQLSGQVSDIMIMDDTLTDADAAEFTSAVSGVSNLSSGLQAKVTNAWTFDENGPVTDKGAINLTSTSVSPSDAVYAKVVVE